MKVHCDAEPCSIILSSKCVFYEGANLVCSGIRMNDTLETVIVKLNDLICTGLGTSVTSGTGGTSGSSSTSGTTGTSGSSGITVSGTSGLTGSSGTSGTSSTSGTSGVTVNSTSGTSGTSGITWVNGNNYVVGDHGTGTTDEVINICYGTSGTPPTASDTTEGAVYFQYIA